MATHPRTAENRSSQRRPTGTKKLRRTLWRQHKPVTRRCLVVATHSNVTGAFRIQDWPALMRRHTLGRRQDHTDLPSVRMQMRVKARYCHQLFGLQASRRLRVRAHKGLGVTQETSFGWTEEFAGRTRPDSSCIARSWQATASDIMAIACRHESNTLSRSALHQLITQACDSLATEIRHNLLLLAERLMDERHSLVHFGSFALVFGSLGFG